MSSSNNHIRFTEYPERNAWAAFVKRHPRGNIFQTPECYDLYASVENYQPGVIAALNEKNDILGVLSYNIIREPGWRKWFSTRSIISGGPLVDRDDPACAMALLYRYKAIIHRSAIIYTQVRNLFDDAALHDVFEQTGFVWEDHLTVHIDLNLSEAELLAGMHKKRAGNIRRTLKKDIPVKSFTDSRRIDEAFNLIRKTYNRVNIPCPPRQLFLKAARWLPGNILLIGAFAGNNMIGCRIYLLYNQCMYDWYAAGNTDYKHLYPNDILPWHAMLWGKANGMKWYDFAGAGKPDERYGVRDYKTRFGGRLINPGRYQLVHRHFLYKLGSKAIRWYKYLR